MPTPSEEELDPTAAETRYADTVAKLRELTRSRDRFPLVFDELATYGFRRNCLGIRPTALGVGVGVIVASAILVWRTSTQRYLIGGGVGLLAVAWWSVCVTPSWVRQAAELYAERLLASPVLLVRD